MARKIVVSSVGGGSAWYPGSAVLGKEHDERLAEGLVEHWQARIESVLPDRPDLIVLPECSSRYRRSFASFPAEEEVRLRPLLHERLLAHLSEVARKHACHIVFPSVARIPGEECWYNAAIVLDRSGRIIGQYDKQFTVVTERDTGILCGETPSLIQCDFGTLGIVICFDLNFEEAFAAYKNSNPDILVFPSMYHGGLMQSYWAYQCRAHLVSAMGQDNLRSEIRTPTGDVLATSTNYVPTVSTEINLDCALVHLDFNGDKLHALKAKLGRGVRIDDPGLLGAVLVTCESAETSVKALLADFGIEPLDAYLERSRSHQRNGANHIG